ncbi:hypothetical protein IAI51_20290 [Pseudomonas sp. N40(2020)]|uniref:hypothetical protein n=1 Tax=Pseudomonas sp. N40(2020) TaxID=2767798 RepID=UPI00165747CD|nr:hypothetical protein [Pseudomonas sp. N40(2020)]MBC8998871.1 hypothetical protein [Pseudomonas sp. N40(2020)]
MNAITWPADKSHLLRATDNGLFQSPEGGTYAHVAGEGYLQVVRHPNGRYQVFWPPGLGEPGPFLKQIEGRPLWRPEAAHPPSLRAEADRQTTVEAPLGRKSPLPLPAEQAAWLTSAQQTPDGIRHDKRGATYVDMEDGATFLVRQQPDGNYQQASAHDRHALGAQVEQIPGNKRWRVKTPEPNPPQEISPTAHERPAVVLDEPPSDRGKRPRLADETEQSGTQPLTDQLSGARPLTQAGSAGHWRHWGKTFKPEWHDSIEVDGQHFVIVPQRVTADTTLVYLENPLFTPSRYDAFERMLTNDPSLQPKWAVKKDDTWTVVELPSFERSLAQTVNRSFMYLSEHSSDAIARAVFNEANQSEVINGEGLRVLFDTFYHWEHRTLAAASRRELADPLMMLPVLPTQTGSRLLSQTLLLPSPFAKALERIDFDTQMFHQLWREAMDTPGSSLRSVFSEILQRNGYEVDRTSRMFSEDALLFQRRNLDVVFVLRIRPSSLDGKVQRPIDPGEEMNTPALRATIGKSKWKHMLEPGKVVYLVGGTQIVSDQQTFLFIVREG